MIVFAHPDKKQYLCSGFKILIIMSDKTKLIIKVVITVIIAALTALGTALGLTSCNVTRSITCESSYVQRGDSSGAIVTKTIETYDATKR